MSGPKDSNPKRPHSELSPSTPKNDEKRQNLIGDSVPPVMAFEDDNTVLEGAPEWAVRMHRSILHSMSKNINFASETAVEAKALATSNSEQIDKLTKQNEELQAQVNKIEEKLIALESYGRKENLILHGVPEKSDENVINIVKDLFAKCGMPAMERKYHLFDRIHRLPKTNTNSPHPRPIIMRFHHHHDREIIWANKSLLTDPTYITEDFPKEVKDRRKQLAPYLALAKRLPSVKKASMRGDKLFMDGRQYNAHQLQQNPNFTKEALATQKQGNVVAFFSKNSKLSNFYPCTFRVGEKTFQNLEQYYAMQKATFAENHDAVDAIMSDPRPEEAKKISNKISKDFSQAQKKEWSARGVVVMQEGLMAKFGQNTDLKDFLLSTGKDIIAEASTDPYWSCGRRLEDDRVFKTDKWSGQNMMGKLLQEVRESLR